MKAAHVALVLVCLAVPLLAQNSPEEGPSSEKARKAFREGDEYLRERRIGAAFDAFKKADKEDGGHCALCQKRVIRFGEQLGEWKAAENAAGELIAAAQEARDSAIAHYELGQLLLDEGQVRRKDEYYLRAHEEFTKALEAVPQFTDALFSDGQALALAKQDDAAKARFEQFVKIAPPERLERQRASLYINEPELARALMAPPFAMTTIDGKHISLDDLQGKVVLIDFWATWCPSCREALPHIKEIAKKFEGQPLVVLSISTDRDEEKWRQFVAKNEMTWPQCRDQGQNGSVAQAFGVHAIPQTFTIDADGILQDQHIGDAAIEGKLKKLVKRAQEKQAQKATDGGTQ